VIRRPRIVGSPMQTSGSMVIRSRVGGIVSPEQNRTEMNLANSALNRKASAIIGTEPIYSGRRPPVGWGRCAVDRVDSSARVV
jgi:hypothetical protein